MSANCPAADVTEEKIGRTMMTATTHRKAERRRRGRRADLGWRRRLRQFAAGDFAPSLVLAVLIIALGAYATGHNIRFVSAFNIEKMLLLTAALSFVGFGQMCVILTGGIDVSVGPLVGLAVVIASFFFIDGSTAGLMIVGLLAMFAAGAAVGLANGVAGPLRQLHRGRRDARHLHHHPGLLGAACARSRRAASAST